MPPEFNPTPLFKDYVRYETRRQFFRRGASFMGAAALGMLAPQLLQGAEKKAAAAGGKYLAPMSPNFAPKAKQVIYLHMVGGPAQMDLYDYKPVMGEWFDKDLPESIRM